MAGKYMKVKRVVIPTLTAIIIASQLMGCACSSQKETLKMLNGNEAIEIEIATPINKEEGTQRAIQWQRLDRLTTYEDFRKEFDLALGMESHNGTKVGVAYIDLDGKQQGNNTLYNAFLNEAFVTKYWENEEMQSILSDKIREVYGDEDLDGVEAYAIINAYWNLLPDNDTNYFNAYSTLTRAEAMTLVMRATTPVEENLEERAEFKEAVGESEYTAYASRVEENSYLQTADESLDEVTFKGTITRAEYLYLLLNTIYGEEEINKEEIEGVEVTDCKDRGNIGEEKKFKGLEKRVKSNILKESIGNPEKGVDSELYKVIEIAKKKGIIGEESRWDEGLTKSEAIELFINTMQAYTTEKGYTVNEDKGITMSELYTEQAKKKYNEIKEELVCDEQIYVNRYIESLENGLTVEETEEVLLSQYSKVEEEPAPEPEPETQAQQTYVEPETQAQEPVYYEPETQAQEPVYYEPETQAPAPAPEPVYTEPETQAPAPSNDLDNSQPYEYKDGDTAYGTTVRRTPACSLEDLANLTGVDNTQ